MLKATFNNIISWWSVLLVEETGGSGENYRPVTEKLYHTMFYSSPCSRFELTTSDLIGTACIVSCKSNYNTITATITPLCKNEWSDKTWTVSSVNVRNQMNTSLEVFVYIVLLCVFTFIVPCCDIRYDFHIQNMVCSSFPPVVCRRYHVLFTLFVLACE